MSIIKKIIILKSATKAFNVILTCTRPLITELSDKLRLKHLSSKIRSFPQLLYRFEDSIRTTSAKCRMEREVVHQMSSNILNT